MITIKFIYENNQYQAIYKDKYSLLIDILLEYSRIINKNIKELYFIYNGKKLFPKDKEKIFKLKNNNIVLFVFNLNNKKENNEVKQIICPKCKEMAIINFDEDKILINNCINKHSIYLSIYDFMQNQCINELKCNICNNDKSLYNEKLYICSCKQYICPLCAISHDETHIMIEYNNRFYKCNSHNNNFISYCNVCNMNLCTKCEGEHNIKHKLILYKEKRPNERKINEIKGEIKGIEEKIMKFKMEIKKLNNLYVNNMNNIINYLNKYILFYENLDKLLDNLQNYESIKNSNNFKNKKLIKDIEEFLNDDIKNKYKKLINIIYDIKNEMTITYENNEKTKLFGEFFIKNNKDNCFLLINGKINDLCAEYNFNKKKKI